MNPKLWRSRLTALNCPPWPCPVCRNGSLELTPESFRREETAHSVAARECDEWQPDWVTYVFNAWAKCGNSRCHEDFALSGTGHLEPVYRHEDFEDDSLTEHPAPYHYEEEFAMEAIFPSLEMFEIPTNCPSEIKQEIRSAFALFWGHLAACAGRLRVALEALMDYLKIPIEAPDKKGKMRPITLGARIDLYSKDEPLLGGYLQGLKSLGNSGSHGSEIRRDSLLQAFQIFDHCLAEIIDKRSESFAAMAAKMRDDYKRKVP
jgi:hypothetical protein